MIELAWTALGAGVSALFSFLLAWRRQQSSDKSEVIKLLLERVKTLEEQNEKLWGEIARLHSLVGGSIDEAGTHDTVRRYARNMLGGRSLPRERSSAERSAPSDGARPQEA